MTEPRTIAEFAKNGAETIRVALINYNGHRLCDIRVLADYAGSRGERQPTRKGVCLKVELIPALITALQDAQEASR